MQSQKIPIFVTLFLLAALNIDQSGGKAVFGKDFPLFQKNYWYEYSTPQSTMHPGEYVDYHLKAESTFSPILVHKPTIVGADKVVNSTAQLGAMAKLDCFVRHLQNKTVSWLKRSLTGDTLPTLLTFGNTVYVNDARVTVKRHRTRRVDDDTSADNWALSILNAQKADEGVYECQIATEPPQIKRVYLQVQAPVLTVMDGFGRRLTDQYYKVGSSLEVMCAVDRLPARPLPELIEWRHGNVKLEPHEHAPPLGHSILTELEGSGAVSRLAIIQARVKHSGIYTCSVSDTISKSLRLHIIDESNAKAIINNSAEKRSASSLTSQTLLFYFMISSLTFKTEIL